MPEVIVYAAEGRTTQQKKQLMKKIADAVADSFSIDINIVVVSIVETKKENKSRGGVPFDEK
ncbi:tautomerase family protein (plasmid) [Klebsiella sp. WOUb02]|uniref:tautomerase family protein n=1 Tax=Klebsiella sp. WOUb02 TaxID=3161071 RepID=UPI003CE72904